MGSVHAKCKLIFVALSFKIMAMLFLDSLAFWRYLMLIIAHMGDHSNIVLNSFCSPQISLLNDAKCDTSPQMAAELLAFEYRPRDILVGF